MGKFNRSYGGGGGGRNLAPGAVCSTGFLFTVNPGQPDKAKREVESLLSKYIDVVLAQDAAAPGGAAEKPAAPDAEASDDENMSLAAVLAREVRELARRKGGNKKQGNNAGASSALLKAVDTKCKGYLFFAVTDPVAEAEAKARAEAAKADPADGDADSRGGSDEEREVAEVQDEQQQQTVEVAVAAVAAVENADTSVWPSSSKTARDDAAQGGSATKTRRLGSSDSIAADGTVEKIDTSTHDLDSGAPAASPQRLFAADSDATAASPVAAAKARHVTRVNPFVLRVANAMFDDLVANPQAVVRFAFKCWPVVASAPPTVGSVVPAVVDVLNCVTSLTAVARCTPADAAAGEAGAAEQQLAPARQVVPVNLSMFVRNNSNIDKERPAIRAAIVDTLPTRFHVQQHFGPARVGGSMGVVIAVMHSTALIALQPLHDERGGYNLNKLGKSAVNLSDSVVRTFPAVEKPQGAAAAVEVVPDATPAQAEAAKDSTPTVVVAEAVAETTAVVPTTGATDDAAPAAAVAEGSPDGRPAPLEEQQLGQLSAARALVEPLPSPASPDTPLQLLGSTSVLADEPAVGGSIAGSDSAAEDDGDGSVAATEGSQGKSSTSFIGRVIGKAKSKLGRK
jgi:hypothetical protein